MYKKIALLYPKSRKLEKLINYSSLGLDARKFIGFILTFSILFGFLIGIYSKLLFNKNPLLSGFVTFILLNIIIYFWFLLSVDAKAKFVESILPDALQLMASNLRAGMTIDRALILSARPEFGPFKDEIERVGKEITLGKELDLALLDLAKRIRSEKLEKTMRLIGSGIRSGGELASLLEHTAEDLKSQELIEKKIRASVNLYVIFISIAIGFGAPMLFALSSFMVRVLGKTMSQVDVPDTLAIPIKISTIAITTDFVVTYSLISLTTTAILGSLIIGLIKKGKEKEGIKMIPILIGISLAVFFIVKYLITGLMSGIFSF